MIKAKKSLGQNFLIDKNILNKIVNLINIKDKSILEIGPGTGNLTSLILDKKPKKFYVIEKDDELASNLKKTFEDKLIVINKDVLEIDETSLFAMFISPTISTAVLENQILTSQILAEAEIATVSVGLTTAEKFVEADISQKDAAKVFARTDELSGLTGAAAGRGNTITEEQIALGVAGLSPQELGLVKRVAAQEASESAIQTGAATTQGGQVVGLVEE